MKKLFVLFIIIGFGLGIIWTVKNTGPKYEEVDLSSPAFQNNETEAPNFRLPTLSGGYIELKEFRGKKPVLLYFWATWCPHCFKVRSYVENLRKKVSQNELEILAINVGSNDSLEHVVKYQKQHPLSVPVLYDRKSEVSMKYGAFGVPLFVLINKDGKLIYWGHEPPDVFTWLKNNKKG